MTEQEREVVVDAALAVVQEALGAAAYDDAVHQGAAAPLYDTLRGLLEQGQARPACATRRVGSILSRRELEVAGLVAETLTNQEIADRLVISTRTAEGHVENVLRKLDFRSRTQIAAWFAAQTTLDIAASTDARPLLIRQDPSDL